MGGNKGNHIAYFLAMHGVMQCQKCGKCPKNLNFGGWTNKKHNFDKPFALTCMPNRGQNVAWTKKLEIFKISMATVCS